MPPHVVVMFGATGDLAQRKLLPGLLHLSCSKLAPEMRVIGTSLDEIDSDNFRKLAHKACKEFAHHAVTDELFDQFIANLTFVPAEWPRGAGERGSRADRGARRRSPPAPLSERPAQSGDGGDGHAAEGRPGGEFPDHHGEALRHRSRQRAEAECGDARRIRRGADLPDRPLPRERGGAQHLGVPIRQRAVRADMESQPDRPHADRRPRDARHRGPAEFYESTGAFRDMVVTHLFQVLAIVAMEPPTALTPRAINEEKNKVFRRCSRSTRTTSSVASTAAIASLTPWPTTPTPRPSSRCAARSTTGDGPASRSSSAPGSASLKGAHHLDRLS